MLRLKKFILPAIIICSVILLTSCGGCGSDTSADRYAKTIQNDIKQDRIKTEESIANKHGVKPTEVTQSGSGIGQSNYKYEWKISFWNVGRLGGFEYEFAEMNLDYLDAPKDFQGSRGSWEGYFTGGPNGDIYLTLKEGINASPKLHFKLKDGKELIKDDGSILKINNPEAFDGWKD